MIDGLDHVAVTVKDLDLAGAAFEAMLGRPPDWREEAAGARHAWFQLENMALDVVQAEGAGETGDRVRARMAEAGEGLWGLAFSVSDLDETRRVLARRAVLSQEPALLLSTDAWRLTFLDRDAVSGVHVALAERAAPPARPRTNDAAAVRGLDHLVIRTRHVDRACALYGARLGLDFRLDRSNDAWGSRLMFFRCGDLLVEVAADLKEGASEDADKLSGLAWRVADPAAARARLAAAGFDVSDVRPGRKPGTSVFTLRSGVPGAPALMIGEGAA